jgi:hypothetical protein
MISRLGGSEDLHSVGNLTQSHHPVHVGGRAQPWASLQVVRDAQTDGAGETAPNSSINQVRLWRPPLPNGTNATVEPGGVRPSICVSGRDPILNRRNGSGRDTECQTYVLVWLRGRVAGCDPSKEIVILHRLLPARAAGPDRGPAVFLQVPHGEVQHCENGLVGLGSARGDGSPSAAGRFMSGR